MDKVVIVLATYNGEKYLKEQLESINSQTYKNFVIVAHDDGSSDTTLEILENYKKKFPGKLLLLKNERLGGARENFGFLLNFVMKEFDNNCYFMCCDQDDIWQCNKIEESVKVIKFYENVFSNTTPLLIHSDPYLIDKNGNTISNSMFSYQNLDPKWGDYFNLILTQNVITGCTMLFNFALLKKSLPIPEDAVMHDWWMGLVACQFGKIIFLPEKYIGYRQHLNNEVGAKKYDTNYILKQIVSIYKTENRRRSLIETVNQARAFVERFSGELDSDNQARVYSNLLNVNYINRKFLLVKNNFRKIGFFRQIAWLVLP